ncbi:MAG: ADP-ribose pyrophosphatase [Candidatus Saccharibacteria bacterium]|nr:ADP-ribose pyrophosphatase [Candidatus Saccharibacteria bacterium]
MKTIKKMWGGVGTGLFWLLWPAWVVYFRISNVRARVLVVCGDEVLLVQGWLGTKNWNLPGGGATKNEKTVSAAARELHEETGILAPESSLTKLASFKHKKYNFKYHGDLFVLSLNEKPELSLRKGEIWNAAWVPLAEMKQYDLDDEARLALRRYQPPERPSLL